MLFRGAEGCGMFALVGAESDGEKDNGLCHLVEIQGMELSSLSHYSGRTAEEIEQAIDDLPDNYMIIIHLLDKS